MRENLFYRSRPGVFGLFVVLWQLVCLACILLFVFLFDETPGISVMAIFGFFASLVAISKGRITVSEDRFVVENIRLIPDLSDREEMPFSEIADIEARLSFFRQNLRITYEDGTVAAITMYMDRAILRDALQVIRKQSPIRVEVVDVLKRMESPRVTQETARAAS